MSEQFPDDLPDDLTALGEQLRDGLAARAGDDPATGPAWASIDGARHQHRRFAVRPIQLLAAAAALVLVVAVATALLRRPADSGLGTTPSTTTPTSTPGASTPSTGPLLPTSGRRAVAATRDGAIVAFDPHQPDQQTVLRAAEPGYEIIDLSVDVAGGELWFTRNRIDSCGEGDDIYRFVPGQDATFVVHGYSPVVRDGKLAYFPTEPKTGFCDTTSDVVLPTVGAGLFPSAWHASLSGALVVRDLASGSEHHVWDYPRQTDELNGIGHAAWTADGAHLAFQRSDTDVYDARVPTPPGTRLVADEPDALGPVAFDPAGGLAWAYAMYPDPGQPRETASGEIVTLAGTGDVSSPWQVTTRVPERVRGVLGLDGRGGEDPMLLAVTGDFELRLWLGNDPTPQVVPGRFVDVAIWETGVPPATPTPTTTAAPTSTSSSTTVAPTSTTTSSTAPPASATTSSTAPVGPVELRGNGIGLATFGDDDEVVINRVNRALGPATSDTGYGDPNGLLGFSSRAVRWDNLSLLFGDLNGRRQLVSWSYGAGSHVLPLPNGATLGMSASDLRSRMGSAGAPEGAEGGTLLCFPDAGQTLCANFDPTWQGVGEPAGTVVAYLAGTHA